ncbi:MAG: Tol-Pal system beta propeller repeat protein TolB [candidate division WOR-3 bacterium]|nr:Tol-Pal system beta propeller repeat protein TolB [candidate division WOR-3 bacterium]
MIKVLLRVITLIFISSPVLSQDVWLRLEVGERRKLGITIDEFLPIQGMESVCDTIREIIEKDLRFSLYFDIKEDAVTHISGEVTEERLHITVYETPRKTRIMNGKYSLSSGIRYACHMASDDIIRTLIGEDGIFRTKIFFLTKIGDKKRITMADYDGYNSTFLNVYKYCLSLAPSPDGRKIAYTAYQWNNLCLYLYDIETQKDILLSNENGLNTAPCFSPDGRKIALSLSKDGNPEIYVIDLKSKKARRLTVNRAIDTSPTWSPTGKEIAFVSDRSGSPQIYIMGSDGTGVRRLTYEGWYNTSPRWSPKEDRIAYVAMDEEKKLNIYTILVTGEGRTCLTFQGNNEEPSWSKDGLHIAFISNRSGKYELYTMHWDGSGQRKILTYGDGIYSSRWSQ